MKSPLSLKPYLFLLVHAGSGAPYALRVNIRRVSGYVILAGFVFLLSGLGTLMFFRELEINRKLADRLLEYETREKLSSMSGTPMRPIAPGMGIPLTAIPGPITIPYAPTYVDRTTSAVAASAPAAPAATNPGSYASAVGARIGELTADCLEEECEVRMSMIPTRTGVAQGELLLVLETEIPRIGAGNPTTKIRKRYFVYPGSQTRDELPHESLTELQRKPFRFTRALQTTANFSIGKLLRPLAVNAYLFDTNKTLIHHERKVIEREEE